MCGTLKGSVAKKRKKEQPCKSTKHAKNALPTGRKLDDHRIDIEHATRTNGIPCLKKADGHNGQGDYLGSPLDGTTEENAPTDIANDKKSQQESQNGCNNHEGLADPVDEGCHIGVLFT